MLLSNRPPMSSNEKPTEKSEKKSNEYNVGNNIFWTLCYEIKQLNSYCRHILSFRRVGVITVAIA